MHGIKVLQHHKTALLLHLMAFLIWTTCFLRGTWEIPILLLNHMCIAIWLRNLFVPSKHSDIYTSILKKSNDCSTLCAEKFLSSSKVFQFLPLFFFLVLLCPLFVLLLAITLRRLIKSRATGYSGLSENNLLEEIEFLNQAPWCFKAIVSNLLAPSAHWQTFRIPMTYPVS